MAPKRPRDDDKARNAPSKKHKKGFSVGPANLPDGIHKRKVQKIKKDLIHKAKLKKEYARLKAREQPDTPRKSVYEDEEEDDAPDDEEGPEPTLEPHPDRVKMLEETSPDPATAPEHRKKKPRSQTFKNETDIATKRREEADARRRAREDAEKERQKRLAERERFRKTMAKARGGPDGKRKLGRESTVLLERVRRMVGSG